MIELDLEIKRKEIKSDIKISKDSVLFFANHLKDKQRILKLFIILNLYKKELIYINSYLARNIEILEKNGLNINKIYVYADPHSIIKISSNKFYIFSERIDGIFPFFYKLDLDQKKLYLYTFEDLNLSLGNVGSISPTNFKDLKNKIILQINYLDKEGVIIESIVESDINFLSNKILFKRKSANQGDFIHVHSVKKYNGYIYTSEFERRFIILDRLNGKKLTQKDFYNKLKKYYDLYLIIKKKCKFKKQIYSKMFDNFFGKITLTFQYTKKQKISFLLEENDLDFISFCNITDYKPKGLPGDIEVINYNNGIRSRKKTTFTCPGHFEINNDNDLYVSSHNFIRLEDKGYRFLGPGAIDKYKIKNGELDFKSSFINKTGFRFTSHKIFNYFGRELICTIGHPNRLFLINTSDMSLYYYFDLGENELSKTNDILYYMNNNNIGYNDGLLALEIINNGKQIIILGEKEIIIFDIEKKKITDNISYIFDLDFPNDINLSDFERSTTHFCKII